MATSLLVKVRGAGHKSWLVKIMLNNLVPKINQGNR